MMNDFRYTAPVSTTEDLILGPLNPEQRNAVETVEGPVLILAGAGSGKTRALTHRIAYLIDRGVPPWQILAVTFTNKAAGEMRQRILHLLKLTSETGRDQSAVPVIGTFHSVCVRMLRRDIEAAGGDRNFVIYDSDDQEKVMKQVLDDLRIPVEDMKPRSALAHIGSFKSEAQLVRDVEQAATTPLMEKLAKIYKHYQHLLRESNAYDFDDLILETVRMLREAPQILARYQNTWKFIHIDEYQDTNHAQYLLVSLLAKEHRNLCVIGDPDQAIYAFRGADIRNILEFENEYKDAACIKLEQNYRSTQTILSAADAVIAVNPNRPEKTMWTERKTGANVVLRETESERAEAEEVVREALRKRSDGMALNDQVVLYRTNAQSRVFEEACLRTGLPYRIVGGLKFYARREVKDVLAYLSLLVNSADTVSLLRVINVPARKIGKTTILKLQAHGNDRKMNLWQTLSHIEMVEGINEATKTRLTDFVMLLHEFKAKAQTTAVSVLAEDLLARIKMEQWLRDDTDEGEARWQNVLELLSVMRKYDHVPPPLSLTSFLEEAALISEVDKLDEAKDDALTLMTVHLCKGLEFKAVTIAGCEEQLFPIGAALIDRAQLEEERRLMYVAMTRAKEHLTLSHARTRTLWGRTQDNPRSRFLDDVPHTLVDHVSDSIASTYAWNAGASRKRGPSLEPYRQHAGGDDIEMNQDVPELEEGTRVAHPHFGDGTVVERRGDVVDIAFDGGFKKTLALSIAPLSIIAETK